MVLACWLANLYAYRSWLSTTMCNSSIPWARAAGLWNAQQVGQPGAFVRIEGYDHLRHNAIVLGSVAEANEQHVWGKIVKTFDDLRPPI